MTLCEGFKAYGTCMLGESAGGARREGREAGTSTRSHVRAETARYHDRAAPVHVANNGRRASPSTIHAPPRPLPLQAPTPRRSSARPPTACCPPTCWSRPTRSRCAASSAPCSRSKGRRAAPRPPAAAEAVASVRGRQHATMVVGGPIRSLPGSLRPCVVRHLDRQPSSPPTCLPSPLFRRLRRLRGRLRRRPTRRQRHRGRAVVGGDRSLRLRTRR
jgi:hypothetical protein